MGDYHDRYDEPRRYKSSRTRPRERDDADYVEETTFIERGRGKPPQELIYRGRDRDDSIEDVQRDFSPPTGRRQRGYDDYGAAPPRRARSVASRRERYDDDDDDDYYGAAGGYVAGRYGRDQNRRRRDREAYYSDDERSPPRRERKKSGLEGALESFGLGGVAGALAGKGGRSPSHDRGSARGSARGGARSRSRPRGEKKQREWAQAAQAALIAGAVEAFKSRSTPGPWTGEKGKRIATAAIGAGGIDKLVDRDPDNKSKRHLVEAVLGGLAANRLANGPARSISKDDRGRSPSRSRSRSVFSRYRSKSRRGSSGSSDRARGPSTGDKIKDAGAGVVLAGVGKQIYDRFRSKSRRRRSPSTSNDESYDERRRGRDRDVGGPYSQSRGGPPDESAVVGPRGRAGNDGAGAGEADRKRDSSTDSVSSTDMEKQRKKMRGKEFLTAGLASIATIHAAHGVYQSMEASDKRHKLVAEGEMTPEEARKKRSKAWLQDAAAVGIAALGIKGAYSEWKEMNEQRHSVKELEERRRARQKRRERRMREARMNGGGTGPSTGPYMSGGAGGLPPSDIRYGPYGSAPPPVGYGR